MPLGLGQWALHSTGLPGFFPVLLSALAQPMQDCRLHRLLLRCFQPDSNQAACWENLQKPCLHQVPRAVRRQTAAGGQGTPCSPTGGQGWVPFPHTPFLPSPSPMVHPECAEPVPWSK